MNTHNSGLRGRIFWLLACIEFFERYGFYVVLSLMILLLTNRMGWSDAHAYTYVAGVTALIYIAPLVGGWVTDNIIDNTLALLIGSIFLCLGYISLTLWSHLGINVGMSLLIIGMAFFKFAPSAMIGEMYKDEKTKLDRLFVIFYVSINVGALFAFFSSGWLQEKMGWYHVFLMPALGLFVASFFARAIMLYKKNLAESQHKYKISNVALLIAGCLLSAAILQVLLHFYHSISVVTLLVATSFVIFIAKKSVALKYDEKNNLLYILIMCLIAIIFFILYGEQSTLITLFTERLCKAKLFNYITIQPSAYAGFDAMWILILSPIVSLLFKKYDKNASKKSLMIKFGMGLIINGIGFYVLALTLSNTHLPHSVEPAWVCLSFAFQALGEILVSALGLSLMAKWAPAPLYNTLMGSWFLVVAIGSCLSGYLNTELASIKTSEPLTMIIQAYHHSFIFLTVMALGTGIITIMISRPICQLLNRKLN
jgi:POT family proton-dependent oligopeptide transporter